MPRGSSEPQDLRRQIAAAAARRIAQDGEEPARALHEAAEEVLVSHGSARARLPDAAMLARALRDWQREADPAGHAARLARRRRLALDWMERLDAFDPYLCGAVLDGSATAQSPLELQLYTDNPKAVEMALLEQGVSFRVGETPAQDRHAHERIGFSVRAGPGAGAEVDDILITVMDPLALRRAAATLAPSDDPLLHPVERAGRAGPAMLRRLLQEMPPAAHARMAHG